MWKTNVLLKTFSLTGSACWINTSNRFQNKSTKLKQQLWQSSDALKANRKSRPSCHGSFSLCGSNRNRFKGGLSLFHIIKERKESRDETVTERKLAETSPWNMLVWIQTGPQREEAAEKQEGPYKIKVFWWESERKWTRTRTRSTVFT